MSVDAAAGEAVPAEVYQFGVTFQKNLLACMARDPSFLAEVSDAIKPGYFTTHPLVVLARILLEHYSAYNARPDYAVIWHKIGEQVKAFELGETLHGELQDLLRELWQIELPDDVTYYRDEVAKFGREQALRCALLEAVEHLESTRGQPEKQHEILPIIQRALCVGSGQGSGIQLFEHGLTPSMFRDKLSDPSRKVKFGLPTIDALSGDGAGAGEMVVFLAGTSVGKSMILTNIAAKAALRGSKVVYVSTEMLPYQIACRALATVSQRPIKDVADENPEYQDAYKRLVTGDRYMRILHLRAHSSVGKLRAMLARVEAYDRIKPDAVFVDYADELCPTRKGEWDSSYQTFGDVYSELIAIGEDWMCPIFTAAQVNRPAYQRRLDGDDFPGLEHMSDSMKKAHLAHFILSVARTPEEKSKNELRIKVAKYRLGPSDAVLRCSADWTSCHLRERLPEVRTDAIPNPVAPAVPAVPAPRVFVPGPVANPHAVARTPPSLARPVPRLPVPFAGVTAG